MREVGAHAVHLVHVAQTWHVVLVGQAPVGFGLWLNTGNTVEHNNSAVEHAQTTVHFDGEVHVSGGVDHVDLVTLPLSRHGSTLNRDTAFLFLFQVIGRRAALTVFRVMHVDDLMLLTGVVQDAFGCSRLARIDVRDDADVAVKTEFFLPSHDVFFSEK